MYKLSSDKVKDFLRYKPRHIAEKLGLKSQTVRNQINNIKNKIKDHEEWLKEKMDVRGLSI